MTPLITLLSLAAVSLPVHAVPGADRPWTTYEAEDMKTTGAMSGPKFDPNTVEREASGQKCVRLAAAGQYVEFAAGTAANALVVRYSLPDAPAGGGMDSTLGLYQNGMLVQKLPVTSRYSWLYGPYPFGNDPKAGSPRNFFDEVRWKGLTIARGDMLRLQKEDDAATDCIVDLVDLELVAPAGEMPAGALSVTDFGAGGDDEADDTIALKKCLAAAKEQGKSAWMPAGVFRIAGEIELPSGTTLQGAGMWHTILTGDAAGYADPARRVKLKGRGDHIHLSDFAVTGKLDHRNDAESNDGIGGSFGEGSTVARIWVEHTKAGLWVVNSSGLVVDGCRFRNTIADGLNFSVGMRNSTAQNCTARGTGDDGFAIWPATYTPQKYAPGFNTFRRCTAQLPFLANGAAIYGGESNRIEDCLFTDIATGSGILLSTTFPVSDEAKKTDNNFSGTTVVQRCELIRCGGHDHGFKWRAAVQLCADRGRNIAGVEIAHLMIRDSISDGFSVVAPGRRESGGVLSDIVLDNVAIPNFGLGVQDRHALWISPDARGIMTISNSRVIENKNDSTHFTLNWK